MQTILSPEIHGCVSQITSTLSSLGHEEQATVLREVSDRLEDLRAKQVYDDVKSGKMETHPSDGVMGELRAKHGF